jgi:hypothetical protein
MSHSDAPAPLRTAVLLVLFNRPAATRTVFETIRRAQPPRLYLAADGPRLGHPEDEAKCREARAVASLIDWRCEVKILFRGQNLGCGRGPAEAYSWFFSHEEEGIILEDDCVPDLSFFPFCQELLEKYRHDPRVMHITGTSFVNGQRRNVQYSYYFSIHPHEWGWASWRRAWQLYDFEIKSFPEVTAEGKLRRHYSSPLEYWYRMSKFRNTYGKPDVSWWDYQWNFALHVHDGLAIVPAVNLVSNIGFGPEATHTVSAKDARGSNGVATMAFPLRHPPVVTPDRTTDRQYFQLQMRRLLIRKLFSFLGIEGYDSRG